MQEMNTHAKVTGSAKATNRFSGECSRNISCTIANGSRYDNYDLPRPGRVAGRHCNDGILQTGDSFDKVLTPPRSRAIAPA